MKEFKDWLIAIIVSAIVWVGLLMIPSAIHSINCDGCDWFWCDNYNGK